MPFVPIVAFPADWRPPAAEIRKAVDDAANEYDPDGAYGLQEIMYAIGWRETNYTKLSVGKKNGANNATYAASYAKLKDEKIPGSSMTWGEMFAPEQWAPFGFMQLNPYHLVGRGKPFKAGVPLTELFNPVAQARAAAALLVLYYKKTGGDWTQALLRYNGSKSYRADVARNVLALREANRAGVA